MTSFIIFLTAILGDSQDGKTSWESPILLGPYIALVDWEHQKD